MTVDEFNQHYSPYHKCIGHYRDTNGDRLSGVLLDSAQKSAKGVHYVYIDNFANRVTLDQLERVQKTEKRWGE